MDGAGSDSGEDGQNHAQRMICVDAGSSPGARRLKPHRLPPVHRLARDVGVG